MYSPHISDLLIRTASEIEAIAKELYQRTGGNMNPDDGNGNTRTLYFDSDCIQHLDLQWKITKKAVNVVSPVFYFSKPENLVFLPLKNGKLDVGGAIGAGNIIVTRYLQNAEPFTGYAELVDGEIASDLTNYLYTSEQTPSSVALGVLVNKEGQVIASGGYFIQAMPGCAEETLAQLEENISLTPYVTQLLELGYTPEKMIETIARGLDVTIQESIELSYKCRCSREKILGALATLGQEDISAMSQDEETEVHCQFCNETYKFSGEEIARLLKK